MGTANLGQNIQRMNNDVIGTETTDPGRYLVARAAGNILRVPTSEFLSVDFGSFRHVECV
jgi:hypothetical protein